MVVGYETKINQTKYNQTKINRGRNPTNCSIRSRDIPVANSPYANNHLEKAKVDALGKLRFGIDCHKTKFY